MTTRTLIGLLLLTTAGCVVEPTMDTTQPDAAVDPAATSELECEGNDLPEPMIGAELSLEPDAINVAISNRSADSQMIEITLHRQGAGGPTTEIAPPIVLLGGASGGVRIAVGDVNGDGEHMKVELVVRGPDGGVVERVFAQARAGRSLAETAAAHGLSLTAPLDGDPVELAGFVPGGRGLDPLSLLAAKDTTDDLAAPTVPPSPLSYNMCFRWPVTLVDAGFGEDYGVDPTSPWVARGGRVSILQSGATLFDGWLDGNGCTGPFAATSTLDFTIFGYSKARVAGNEVSVRDAAGSVRSFVIWDADPGPNQTPVFVFPEVEGLSTMLAVAAYTVTKLHGDVTNQTIAIENRCKPGGCCNCASDGSIWVTSPSRKFLVAHELGHRILGLSIGSYNNDVSFDLVKGNIAGVCDTTSTHSMWSTELESGAAMEGWAHFAAVTAFNSADGINPGASMRYWSASGDTTVDVEAGPTGGASTYFDTVCPGVASVSRYSVELDWLRQFWDYHTDSGPGVRPTFAAMMTELDAAPPWTNSTTWSNIGTGIGNQSGDAQRTRWVQLGATNGVD